MIPFQSSRFRAIFAFNNDPHSVCFLRKDICSRLILICNGNLQGIIIESCYPRVDYLLLFQQAQQLMCVMKTCHRRRDDALSISNQALEPRDLVQPLVALSSLV